VRFGCLKFCILFNSRSIAWTTSVFRDFRSFGNWKDLTATLIPSHCPSFNFPYYCPSRNWISWYYIRPFCPLIRMLSNMVLGCSSLSLSIPLFYLDSSRIRWELEFGCMADWFRSLFEVLIKERSWLLPLGTESRAVWFRVESACSLLLASDSTDK
jgi:hypothetical protein